MFALCSLVSPRGIFNIILPPSYIKTNKIHLLAFQQTDDFPEALYYSNGNSYLCFVLCKGEKLDVLLGDTGWQCGVQPLLLLF